MKRFCSPVPVLALVVLQFLVTPIRAALIYENYTFTTFAGPAEAGSGWYDGNGRGARFFYPEQIAIDGNDNLYVTDANNHTIRKVFPDGRVTTLAGLAGSEGSADGFCGAARFNLPQGIAVDNAGNIFVADTFNHTIRKITGNLVSTIAGLSGKSGSTDGAGSAARFNRPVGVAADNSGNLYVADTYNHTIRKIDANGNVSTIAGTAGVSGIANGAGTSARFNQPFGITLDASGNLLIGDILNFAVRKVTPAGQVTTFAGKAGTPGTTDGTAATARFGYPAQLNFDKSGNLFVVDAGYYTVRKITPDGTVSTVAGAANFPGSRDGTNTYARFNQALGLAVDSKTNVFIVDSANNTLRKLSPDGMVTTLAGLVQGESGTNNDATELARFNLPFGLTMDQATNLYVADTFNQLIRKVTPSGEVTTVAGVAGTIGANDGPSSTATFSNAYDVAVDRSGVLYVADTGNFTIRKIATDGTVTTLAGAAGIAGTADGSGTSAKFESPYALALDSANNLFVADTFSHTIRKITPGGVVTTFAGKAGVSGSNNGKGSAATFKKPYGLAMDAADNLYVADAGNHTIRKITSAGEVTTLAGKAGTSGASDGSPSQARFESPLRLAVDSAGNVFVTDYTHHLIRKITPDGNVTTVAGSSSGDYGTADGTGSNVRFDNPEGIVAAPDGSVYVADVYNNSIRKGAPALPDFPIADVPFGPVNLSRNLSISNKTTATWSWDIIRYPSSSLAQLSSASTSNPTLQPDVPDLFQVRLRGWDAQGHAARGFVYVGVDTTLPIVNFTSPNSGQRWSNAVFTATGTAKDDAGVASVWCQVNQGNPIQATGTTNWSAALPLTPGTNILSVYAVDLSGNHSATTNVSIVYVLSAPLVVETLGSGTIKPNYNGQWLEIGKTYSMQATAAKSFAFVGWTGSQTTNSANLVFLMESNLTFTANFRDSVKPTLTITAPKLNQKWSNAVFTVTGTAKDNGTVASVWCDINGNNNWTQANGTTNWSLDVALTPGTNVVRAYALDGDGNSSTTNSAKLVYILSDKLTLLVTGVGSVSPNYSNAFLQLGARYSLTAKAGNGYLFSNWTDGAQTILSESATLAFNMQSNLVLEANFVENPFLARKGSFAGLFLDSNNIAVTNAGYMTATLTDKGAFTSKWLLAGSNYSLAGQFSLGGSYSNSLARPGKSPLSIQLNLDLNGNSTLGGLVSDGIWSAPLEAFRQVYSRSNPLPQGAGKYTLIIPGTQDSSAQPGGYSAGAVTVDTSGNVSLTGSLSDGSKVSQKTFLSSEGRWPFYLALYSGTGVMMGWLNLTNDVQSDLSGVVSWIKLPQPAAKLYPLGFDLAGQLEATGSSYTYSNGVAVLPNFTNGLVVLEQGNLSQPITNGFTLKSNNQVTTTNKTNLKITTSTGLFQGGVVGPDGKLITVSGALLQKQGIGLGYFTGTNQSGSVMLIPQP